MHKIWLLPQDVFSLIGDTYLPVRMMNSCLSFKIQLKCHLLQDAFPAYSGMFSPSLLSESILLGEDL